MKFATKALIIVAGLTSLTTVAAVPRISMTGFGQVRIGSSIPTLERILGKRINPASDEEETNCRFASPDDLVAGVGLMLIDGQLVRLDVSEPGILTVSGVGVGDSQASVMARYGSGLKLTPHVYTGPEGKYLTMFSKDGRYGIRFETDGAKVTEYYVGTAEAIQYIEGCL
jgi:hypothetical protein